MHSASFCSDYLYKKLLLGDMKMFITFAAYGLNISDLEEFLRT